MNKHVTVFCTALVAACGTGVIGDQADFEDEPRQTLANRSKCVGGEIFDWSYCSAACRCGEAEGDCDRDSDCEEGLICRRNVGKYFGVDWRTDVCLPEGWEPGDDCFAGVCETPRCNAGGQICEGVCVDVANSRRHCGGCGQACPADTICGGGFCKACVDDLTVCGNGCVDIENDTQNCGDCGQVCPSETMCIEGSCQRTCAPGEMMCGECVDVATSEQHCGGCGFMCAGNETCDGGKCMPEWRNCGNGVCEPGEHTSCIQDCTSECASSDDCLNGGICWAGRCVDSPPECEADSDCIDFNDCTEDKCNFGVCEHFKTSQPPGCNPLDADGDGVLDEVDNCPKNKFNIISVHREPLSHQQAGKLPRYVEAAVWHRRFGYERASDRLAGRGAGLESR